MPKEINCPDCDGRGWFYPINNVGGSCKVLCAICKDGKITVYTKEELQEAIKREREECALICEELEGRFEDQRFSKAIRARGSIG